MGKSVKEFQTGNFYTYPTFTPKYLDNNKFTFFNSND